MDFLNVNAKALVLLGLIILAAVAQAIGLDVGLDIEHYVALLVADLGVWAVPNADPQKTP